MWSFLDLRPAKLRPKMHLSVFTDSEVEDKQILHIKSEQMLPKVPKVRFSIDFNGEMQQNGGRMYPGSDVFSISDN